MKYKLLLIETDKEKKNMTNTQTRYKVLINPPPLTTTPNHKRTEQSSPKRGVCICLRLWYSFVHMTYSISCYYVKVCSRKRSCNLT